MGEPEPHQGALRVAVAIKQVLDPEAPTSLLTVADGAVEVVARGVGPVLDPYGVHALVAALQVREQCGGEGACEITVVAAGPPPSRNQYLKALAAGADRVVALDAGDRPGQLTASEVSAARLAELVGDGVGGAGPFDLLLVGRRAADTNAGVVGARLAEMLGWPVVSLVTRVESCGHDSVGVRRLVVERLGPGGPQVVSVRLPAVLTVSHEVGELPMVPFATMIDAKRKPFDVRSTPVGDVVPSTAPTVVGLRSSAVERRCELVEAPTSFDGGRRLAELLGDHLRS